MTSIILYLNIDIPIYLSKFKFLHMQEEDYDTDYENESDENDDIVYEEPLEEEMKMISLPKLIESGDDVPGIFECMPCECDEDLRIMKHGYMKIQDVEKSKHWWSETMYRIVCKHPYQSKSPSGNNFVWNYYLHTSNTSDPYRWRIQDYTSVSVSESPNVWGDETIIGTIKVEIDTNGPHRGRMLTFMYIKSCESGGLYQHYTMQKDVEEKELYKFETNEST